MSAPSKPVSWSLLLTLICLGSGSLLLAFAHWFIAPPAPKDTLRELSGTVTGAADVKHYKEPKETSSFELSVEGQQGDPVRLYIVKQGVAPEEIHALVSRPITAWHDGSLIYELKSDGGTLFTYEDTARIVAQEAQFFYWGGFATIALGLAFAIWSYVGRQRAGSS